MLNATFSLLLIGAPVLFLGIALALRRSIRNRRESAAAFRGYFASCDDRDFFQLSDLSETDAWRNESQSSFAPFRLRHPETNELGARDNREDGLASGLF